MPRAARRPGGLGVDDEVGPLGQAAVGVDARPVCRGRCRPTACRPRPPVEQPTPGRHLGPSHRWPGRRPADAGDRRPALGEELAGEAPSSLLSSTTRRPSSGPSNLSDIVAGPLRRTDHPPPHHGKPRVPAGPTPDGFVAMRPGSWRVSATKAELRPTRDRCSGVQRGDPAGEPGLHLPADVVGEDLAARRPRWRRGRARRSRPGRSWARRCRRHVGVHVADVQAAHHDAAAVPAPGAAAFVIDHSADLAAQYGAAAREAHPRQHRQHVEDGAAAVGRDAARRRGSRRACRSSGCPSPGGCRRGSPSSSDAPVDEPALLISSVTSPWPIAAAAATDAGSVTSSAIGIAPAGRRSRGCGPRRTPWRRGPSSSAARCRPRPRLAPVTSAVLRARSMSVPPWSSIG